MTATQLGAKGSERNRAPSTDAQNLLQLSINGCTPFLSHQDALSDRIKEAHAIAMIFELAFRTAADVERLKELEVDTIEGLNPTIVGDAIQGLQTLLALAQFHADAGRA